jgi:hypothetical protein
MGYFDELEALQQRLQHSHSVEGKSSCSERPTRRRRKTTATTTAVATSPTTSFATSTAAVRR